VHPIQTERFEVLEGRMRFRLGARHVDAGPGDVLDLALLARTYDEEAHAPRLTVALQRILLAPLVTLARARRRRHGGISQPAAAAA
jgi:hypothetical protein